MLVLFLIIMHNTDDLTDFNDFEISEIVYIVKDMTSTNFKKMLALIFKKLLTSKFNE